MNLLDAYIYEVGRRLPPKNRKDIEAEIRSALQDMLDEKSRERGKPADDEMTMEVLKSYGDPEKVAASYRGERYLIGPKLYPTFERVVTIVLPIIVILSLVGLGVDLANQNLFGVDVFTIIAKTLGNIIWTVISTIGIIAVVFTVIERSVPEFQMKIKEKEWDPHSLLKIVPTDHLKVGGLIVDIIFSVIALVVFNFFTQLINVGYYANGGWWVGFLSTNSEAAYSTTWLSQAFFNYLPLLDLAWGASIVLNILLLAFGRWQTWSRWAYIGLKVFSIGLTAVMLAGPSLIGVTATGLTAAGFPDAGTANLIVETLKQGMDLALILAIFFGGVDIVKTFIRMVRTGNGEK